MCSVGGTSYQDSKFCLETLIAHNGSSLWSLGINNFLKSGDTAGEIEIESAKVE